MDLVPIKLIKNKDVRNSLLRTKGETAEIDTSDYIESKMNTSIAARYLMAIEDAAEMAKQLLQRPGIFEQIGKDIKKEAGYDFKFKCRRTSNMTKLTKNRNGTEYLHIAHTYPSGDGHYALAKINHTTKNIKLFNSMGAGRAEFKKELRTVYGNAYTISNKQSSFQPTGGFVTTNDRKLQKTSQELQKLTFGTKKFWKSLLRFHNMMSCHNITFATLKHSSP
jgi:hypothetical protein